MARLAPRNKLSDHYTGKTLAQILEKDVQRLKRGALTGYVCGVLNELLQKGLGKKKGVRIDQFKTFEVQDSAFAMAHLATKEFDAAYGYGDEVSKKLKKYGIDISSQTFAIAVAMDVNVTFKNKAGIAEKPSHKVKGFTTYVHEKSVKVYDKRFIRLPTKDGSIIIYMPKKSEEITHEFRKSLIKSKFRVEKMKVCVPEVDMKARADLAKYVDVRASDLVDGADLRVESYVLDTTFTMDAVGARIKQAATMKLTKSAAPREKVIKFDKPFVVVVERGGQEIFAGAVNKNDWVKG